MACWFFHGAPVQDNDIPDEAIGFIYRITNLQNSRMYIGKKQLFRSIKRVRKGKRSKRVVKPSDWQDYYGSCNALLDDIEKFGKEQFHREILCFAKTKGDLSFFELREQVQCDVLRSDSYYNSIIQCRIHRRHLSKVT